MSEGGRDKTDGSGLLPWITAGLVITGDVLLSLFRWLTKEPSDAVPPINVETPLAGSREHDVTMRPVTSQRRNWGTFFAFCSYLVSGIGAIGFLIAYWTDAGNHALGGTLALALAGLGASLIFYAHWLVPGKQTTEPREVLRSSSEEREAVLRTFRTGKDDVNRRGFLTWILVTTSGMFAAIVVSLMRSLGSTPDPVLYDTVWKSGQKLLMEDGTAMSADSLQPGDSVTVFPEGNVGEEHAQTVLIRVDERFLRLPSERASWAPKGYVAYSRVCTHAGCPVGIYEKTTCLLLCPCHQSTFEVLNAAHPNSGPAARPLPQLPLYLDTDGTLRAGGPFTNPPGPGFWGMPES